MQNTAYNITWEKVHQYSGEITWLLLLLVQLIVVPSMANYNIIIDNNISEPYINLKMYSCIIYLILAEACIIWDEYFCKKNISTLHKILMAIYLISGTLIFTWVYFTSRSSFAIYTIVVIMLVILSLLQVYLMISIGVKLAKYCAKNKSIIAGVISWWREVIIDKRMYLIHLIIILLGILPPHLLSNYASLILS